MLKQEDIDRLIRTIVNDGGLGQEDSWKLLAEVQRLRVVEAIDARRIEASREERDLSSDTVRDPQTFWDF